MTQAQAFRIIVEKPGVVYAEDCFYKPRLRWKTDAKTKPILDYVFTSESLNAVTSEKGEYLVKKGFTRNRDAWHRQSIFGIFAAFDGRENNTGSDALLNAIDGYPIWLCDDDGREVADLIGVDEVDKRIAFVHGKIGKKKEKGSGFNVDSLQEVCRQALASLAFISRGEPSPIWTPTRWESLVQANTVQLTGRNRVFRDGTGLSFAELDIKLKRAISNQSFDREIWIVGAKMVKRAMLEAGLDAEPFVNRLRQFLMHWDALQTACARANVHLHLYCD